MDRSKDLSRGTVERAPAASTGRQSSLFVTSTEKAFLVLQAFDGPRRHLTLAEVARVAGLDRSAAQRFVHTLETLGYLSRTGDGRSYGLTSKVLQFSLNYIRSHELIDRASPYLLDLSRSLGETANLHELDGSEVVFVARFPGRHLVNVNIVVGSRLPALFTASGTAILSCLSEEEREDILMMTRLEKVTPFTEIDPDALRARVREAGRTGYAIVVDETVLGDISVAAAVTDEQGRPIAGVNVSVPTTRWTVERARYELAKHVQVAATSISKGRLATSSPGI